MNTVMMIIELTVAVAVGFAFGAMWGLSQHRALLDWLQARTIRRWMAAMQSLGYEQEDIDAVLERMGSKIMPPYIPAPTHVLTPEKPSLSEKLTELHIGVATHEDIPAEDVDVIMQLCIDYAQRIHAAARANSFDLLEVDLQNEWMKRSHHDYCGKWPRVRIDIDDYKEDNTVQVLFDVVRNNED